MSANLCTDSIVAVGYGINDRIWGMDGQPQAALERSINGAEFAVFSPDGTIIAGSDGEYSIMFWDAQTGRLVGTIQGVYYGPLAFSPDGRALACIERTKIHMWRLER